MESLGKGRAAGAETEHESPAGTSLQAGGAHGQRRRATTPHGEHARPDPDPVGLLRDLRKEDDRIMGPALCHADGLDAGCFRAHRKPHDHVGARLERRESDADAHAATLATDRPVVNP